MYDRIARYYDLSHNRLTADTSFLLDQASQTGGPILELGCGSGRLLVPLARAGFDVTGIDMSAEMLARARLRLAAEPPLVNKRVELIEGDITTLDYSRMISRYGLIVFGYNTFMHLDETRAGRTIRRIKPALAPGGRLILDLENPIALAAMANDPDFVLEDTLQDEITGETIRQYTAYEALPGEQAIDVTWVYESTATDRTDATSTQVRLRYHYLYPHQVELMLGLVGLRLLGFYGSYAADPFHEESDRLIVVAAAEK